MFKFLDKHHYRKIKKSNFIPANVQKKKLVLEHKFSTDCLIFDSITRKVDKLDFKIGEDVMIRIVGKKKQMEIARICDLFWHPFKEDFFARVRWYYRRAQVKKSVNCEKPAFFYCSDTFEPHRKELFATKQEDIIPMNAVWQHAYVLTFNEFCRNKATDSEDLLNDVERESRSPLWERAETDYSRRYRQPHNDTENKQIFFCRNVYDVIHKKLREPLGDKYLFYDYKGVKGKRTRKPYGRRCKGNQEFL